mmetsp:Transcript_28588/g.54632  ORF Transcript_28588/g.54632 Transcript_28588/m.54632 type:complete len:116 (+) Transcript_28588:93-440(+)
MAAVCSSSAALVTPVAVQRVQIRKNFAGVKVAQKKAMCKAVFKTQAVCKSEQPKQAAAALVSAVAASTTFAPVAEAAMTPSLQNTLNSFVAGGVVLGAILVAVIGVSTFDRVKRS